MSLSSVWASLAKENDHLRLLTVLSLLAASICAMAACIYGFKEPVVVDRGCFSKLIATNSNERSEDEVVTFLKIALEKRFNTLAHAPDQYLSLEQLLLRQSEQDEMKRRSMSQNVLVNSIVFDEKRSLAVIDADKLISVGTIRSGFRFPLEAKYELTDRTESNPYGLVLTSVKEPEKGKDEKNE